MAEGFYGIRKNVLDEEALSGLIDGICHSDFLGKSPLGDEFVNTLGFSIVFRRDAVDEVKSRFPYLRPFLSEVLFDDSNAFYINPLLLSNSSKVGAHIDCRLLPEQNTRIIPNLVSVFYAEVSQEMEGGRLILNLGAENETTILPETNSVVHFLGQIIHEVTEVVSDNRRICVVCEQYNLDDQLLSSFPYCELITDKDIAPRVKC